MIAKFRQQQQQQEKKRKLSPTKNLNCGANVHKMLWLLKLICFSSCTAVLQNVVVKLKIQYAPWNESRAYSISRKNVTKCLSITPYNFVSPI